MDQFPWSVVILLSCGLAFTAYIIYYILKLAYEEMKDEATKSNSISNESKH